MRILACLLAGLLCLCTREIAQGAIWPNDATQGRDRISSISFQHPFSTDQYSRIVSTVQSYNNSSFARIEGKISKPDIKFAVNSNVINCILCTNNSTQVGEVEPNRRRIIKPGKVINKSSKAVKRSKPKEENIIIIKDATYRSKWHTNRSCSKFDDMHYSCDNRKDCEYICDNDHSSCRDPKKGDDKECIFNYACSNRPSKVFPVQVDEHPGFRYKLSCPN